MTATHHNGYRFSNIEDEVVSKTIERLFYHFVVVVEWTIYYPTIADKDFLL